LKSTLPNTRALSFPYARRTRSQGPFGRPKNNPTPAGARVVCCEPLALTCATAPVVVFAVVVVHYIYASNPRAIDHSCDGPSSADDFPVNVTIVFPVFSTRVPYRCKRKKKLNKLHRKRCENIAVVVVVAHTRTSQTFLPVYVCIVFIITTTVIAIIVIIVIAIKITTTIVFTGRCERAVHSTNSTRIYRFRVLVTATRNR
jgi:hypothetical protein